MAHECFHKHQQVFKGCHHTPAGIVDAGKTLESIQADLIEIKTRFRLQRGLLGFGAVKHIGLFHPERIENQSLENGMERLSADLFDD